MRSLRRYYVVRRGRNFAVLDATTGAVAEISDAHRRGPPLARAERLTAPPAVTRAAVQTRPERRVRDDRAVPADDPLHRQAVRLDRLLERPRARAERATGRVRVAVDEEHALGRARRRGSSSSRADVVSEQDDHRPHGIGERHHGAPRLRGGSSRSWSCRRDGPGAGANSVAEDAPEQRAPRRRRMTGGRPERDERPHPAGVVGVVVAGRDVADRLARIRPVDVADQRLGAEVAQRALDDHDPVWPARRSSSWFGMPWISVLPGATARGTVSDRPPRPSGTRPGRTTSATRSSPRRGRRAFASNAGAIPAGKRKRAALAGRSTAIAVRVSVWITLPSRRIEAVRGKRTRAPPVAARTERQPPRVHDQAHVAAQVLVVLGRQAVDPPRAGVDVQPDRRTTSSLIAGTGGAAARGGSSAARSSRARGRRMTSRRRSCGLSRRCSRRTAAQRSELIAVVAGRPAVGVDARDVAEAALEHLADRPRGALARAHGVGAEAVACGAQLDVERLGDVERG